MNNNYNVIDLFAGAGGMSEGFETAGFSVLAALELNNTFSETFRYNHKETKIITADITDTLPSDFLKSADISSKNIDIIVGGPPCQGFSHANRQRFIDDPRNRLYKEFIKYINFIKPKLFLMENVKGMLSKKDEIKKDFHDMGYGSDCRILNCSDFGIPQKRERIFFIGAASDSSLIDSIFKKIGEKKCSSKIPLKDALWGLRKLRANPEKNSTNKDSEIFGFETDCLVDDYSKAPDYIQRINHYKKPDKIYNHKARYNNKRDLEIFRRLPQGGKSDHQSIADIMPYKRRSNIFRDKFYKLPENKPSKTICAHMKFDCHMYIHPTQARGLTPREAARIQSFPDDYRFLGPFTRWYEQVGNAVPPLLAEIIAKSIYETLEEHGKK